MQINILPLGSSSTSVGEFVAEVIASLEGESVKYKVTDMGTLIEGDAGDLFSVASRIHEVLFQRGEKRVVTQIVIDDRRDKTVKIGDKVSSVEHKLGSDKH
jgi:uncharacterized protein (TIGR00106 family)